MRPLIFNHGVEGSSPSALTKSIKFRPRDITGIGTKPTVDGYTPRVSAGAGMFDIITWRNVVLFMAALAITSCLMAWGMIIAVDRLIYAEWDKATGTQRVQPLRFEPTD